MSMFAEGLTTPSPTPDDALRTTGRQRELEAVYALSTILSAATPFDVALPQALQQVLSLFGYPTGTLRILDPSSGNLPAVAVVGADQGLAAELWNSANAAGGENGLAVLQRALVVVDDLSAEPHSASVWHRYGYRSFVSVPLFCRGMLLGCLDMASREKRPLDHAAQQVLSTLANQIGMAIANAELYSAAQRKIEYLSALHQCSRDLGPAPDLAQVHRITTERMAQLLRLDRAALFYWNREEDRLEGGAGFGFTPGAIEGVSHPVSPLAAAVSALRERQVWLAESASSEGLLPGEVCQTLGISSALAVPLTSQDQVLGFLVGDRVGAPLLLTADEMDLAMIFANQASVWLANARLFIREQAARAEAEKSEANFRDLLEMAPDAILLVDAAGRIQLINGEAEHMFGYSREELTGQPVELLLPERFRHSHVEHRNRYRLESRTRPMGIGLDLYALRKDGTELPVEISLSPTSTDGDRRVISVIRDITPRRQSEDERLQLLDRERRKSEQLKLAVREAHHRIKNNLQAISDLLYLELSSYEEPAIVDVLRESVERIQSIALVHDLLSQDEDVQTVDSHAMAERLVPMVLQSGGRRDAPVDLVLQVPAVPLSSKRATTLALILNELVSNAVKHAFPGRGGVLEVRLEPADEGLRLTVQDDGPGLPADFDFLVNANVGLQVVRTLAERDMNGKFMLSRGPRLAATVWFPW